MNIAIIGTGYVGLVSGACFAELGNKVHCVDVDSRKIENLKQGILPIYEPGLEEIIKRTHGQTLLFTTSLAESLEKCEIVFIAVGTPMGEDGSADLQYVEAVAKQIAENMSTDGLIVVNKSTVPVGTADKVRKIISDILQKNNKDLDFDVVSNPEFLKEGAAIKDFMAPDRVIIGAEKSESFKKMRYLYSAILKKCDRIIEMDVRSAEMTKYAANSMLATKISFMNEMANICEKVGADINQVRLGIGSDSRIGYQFIYPGIGYGGSCFPKDVKALIKTASDNGYEPKILQKVEEVNEKQKTVLLEKIRNKYSKNLNGRIFAVWGLSFKPGTDDMREAPSIPIIQSLVSSGAKVQVYDPQAMIKAKEHYLKNLSGVEYAESKYDALNNADALLLLTEWKIFRSPDFFEIENRLKEKIIFDGRNQYNVEDLEERSFEYHRIGVISAE